MLVYCERLNELFQDLHCQMISNAFGMCYAFSIKASSRYAGHQPALSCVRCSIRARRLLASAEEGLADCCTASLRHSGPYGEVPDPRFLQDHGIGSNLTVCIGFGVSDPLETPGRSSVCCIHSCLISTRSCVSIVKIIARSLGNLPIGRRPPYAT